MTSEQHTCCKCDRHWQPGERIAGAWYCHGCAEVFMRNLLRALSEAPDGRMAT